MRSSFRARMSFAPSPRQALPCMQASVVGCSAAGVRGPRRSPGVGVVVERGAEGLARGQVALGERHLAGAALGEEVAAEQGAGRVVDQQAGVPAVQDVRVSISAPSGDRGSVNRRRRGRAAAGRRCRRPRPSRRSLHTARRRGGEPIVEGRLVGLEVGEADVAQALHGHEAATASLTSGNMRRGPWKSRGRRGQVLVEVELADAARRAVRC